ncbi:hypothetical protein II810_03025 [bacterium]|nr:hypothetical protein [bacterium]
MVRRKKEADIENEKLKIINESNTGEKCKLDILKEVVANQGKKEYEKQRQIYSSMSKIQVERKG